MYVCTKGYITTRQAVSFMSLLFGDVRAEMKVHLRSVRRVMWSGVQNLLPRAMGTGIWELTETDRQLLLARVRYNTYILVALSYLLFYMTYAEFGEFQKLHPIFKVSGLRIV